MPPKKGKEEAPPEEKLTQVDRTFYELTITDINNKLARLRTDNARIEHANEELVEKMRQYEEDRTDTTAFLDRQLTEKTDLIKEMEEQLAQLEKQRSEETKTSNLRIKERDLKYKAMNEQLTSEIKLLNGKLNSLEEFRVQKDELLTRFSDQELEMGEQRRVHKEAMYEMEQKAIIEKDQLKKEVEAKLLHLSEEFTKSSEIRIAGYTRRLIRENIALSKEMDKMVVSQVRMEQEHKDMQERAQELEHLFASNEATKQRLVKTCENQIKIIEKLTYQYEQLQNQHRKLTHYRKLYESTLKKDICEQFTFNELTKKLRVLSQRVELLKQDKASLMTFHQKHENEIQRLRTILGNIKHTVQSAIRAEEEEDEDKLYRETQRQNLLTELMQIVGGYSDDITITPSITTVSSGGSVYRPGVAGFMPKSTASLLEIFKRDTKHIPSTELITREYQAKASESRFTPRPRKLEADTMLDIESGTTLVFSGDVSEQEAPPEEAEPEGEFSSSDDDVPAAKEEDADSAKDRKVSDAKKEAVSKKPSVTSAEAAAAAAAAAAEKTGDEEGEFEGEEEENEAYYFYY